MTEPPQGAGTTSGSNTPAGTATATGATSSKSGRAVSSFMTSRPVAILMMFIAAVVFGFFSYGRLPVTLMPELSYPTLTVRTEYPGAAPEEVENDISRPIEEQLGVIGGLVKLSSVSRAEISDVVLEFSWDTDMSEASQDVMERLDLVLLPDEAQRPLILHFDPSLDPVLDLSLSGEGPAFEGEEGLRRLRRIADLQVKRQLEPIKGIAAVRVKGGLEEEIHVRLREDALRRTGIPIQQVITRLQQENINVAGGTIQEGRTEYLVRTLNEYQNLDQISETIVTSIEGRDVRIRDLGEVVRTHKERQIMTRTDGLESVQVEIYKEADANIVALAKRVKLVMGDLQRRQEASTKDTADEDSADSAASSGAAAGGKGDSSGGTGLAQKLYDEESAVLVLVADRSLFIESSIREVRTTAMLGGLLAVLILFLFLRHFPTTLIIAVSIPISLLVTFAPLHVLGVTLNIMSLGGLALGIGMLVDSSIVVLESIQRCRDEGDDLVPAAIRGTAEVRSAVVASILTSIAVFFPMVFVEGVAGQAFGDLGVAVVVSLLASMVAALYLIPMLASRRGLQVASLGEVSGLRLRRFNSALGLVAAFRSIGTWRKRHKLFFILAICMLPVSLIFWLVRFVVGFLLEVVGKLVLLLFMILTFLVVRVIAPVTRRVFRILMWTPVWLVDRLLRISAVLYPKALRWALNNQVTMLLLVVLIIWGTWTMAKRLDSELLPEVHQGEFTVEVSLPVGTPLEQTDTILAPVEQAILEEKANIRSVLLTLGYDPSQSERSDEGEHTARFRILLERSGNVRQLEEQVTERLRGRFANIPDLKSQITRPVLFSSKTPIEVEVHGDELIALKSQTDKVQAVMSGLPELADVTSPLQSGAPEIQVIYDRERLSRYGLNINTVARLVRDKVKGAEATRFNLRDRTIPILVQLSQQDRQSVEDVENLIVNPGGDRPIRLVSVAQVTVGEGPSEIRRIDSRRVGLIRANLGEGSLSNSVQRIRQELDAGVVWPTDINYFISGQNEEWERSKGSLYLALGLSIFLVYVIMAIQFESLLHPLVIMVTIPLAFIGTMLALFALQIPLSIVVFLGMIMLAGIVVNNAIVLVDYINQLRRRGLELHDAIVQAGSVRLRPILMTTATTVLGLTPMALGLGDGAEIRTPMAIAVIAGLLTSTGLTLLIIPTIYAAMDGLVGRWRSPGSQRATSAPAMTSTQQVGS